jgi:Uma2 family endonuclease
MSTPVVPPVATEIPPLRDGDRLTRDEFERRYNAMPQLNKAELIEGVVFMPSPVNYVAHGSPHGAVATWLGFYSAQTPGVGFAIDSTVRLDEANEPQPDAQLRIERGGQSRIDEDGYVAGGPELAVEVSGSRAAVDRNAKLRAYQRNRVGEYLIWLTWDGAFDWFVLRGGRYEALPAGADGILRSEVFPGLWLDAAALLRQDVPRVLAVLQQGLASQEHADFVARLGAPEARPA